MLVAGREREYLAQLFELRAHHPHLVLPELDVYVRTYAAPGGCARPSMVPESGHGVPEEQPEAFLGLVEPFLDGPDGT
jgi:pimeloyl-ACP methyl ester carboxylesterase